MRFMIMRKADDDTETGKMPSDELLMAMGQYNESLQKAGVLLDGMGLHPTSAGARVTFKNGKPIVTDGPFAETKELLAGFTLIQVKDREEAIEWVKRWPAMDGDGNVTLELRRVYEMEDFEESPGLEQHRKVDKALNAASLQLNPYLNFNGNCRDAFTCYEQVLGGTVEELKTYGDTPMCDQFPAEMKDRIAHVRLRVGDFMLMGSDTPPQYFRPPQGISNCLNVQKPEEAQRIFNALADNGTINMPLEKTFWAKQFGELTDRFGIRWTINCE